MSEEYYRIAGKGIAFAFRNVVRRIPLYMAKTKSVLRHFPGIVLKIRFCWPLTLETALE
jgi:hypothetical protein